MNLQTVRQWIGRRVRVKARPLHSSIDARTYAGRTGRLYGYYREGNECLGAVLFNRAVSWVDARDLEEVRE
jgi:hypothetical protein